MDNAEISKPIEIPKGEDEGKKPRAFFREVIRDSLKIGTGFPFPQTVWGLTDTQKKEVQS